jgi:hypothetical protein
MALARELHRSVPCARLRERTPRVRRMALSCLTVIVIITEIRSGRCAACTGLTARICSATHRHSTDSSSSSSSGRRGEADAQSLHSAGQQRWEAGERQWRALQEDDNRAKGQRAIHTASLLLPSRCLALFCFCCGAVQDSNGLACDRAHFGSLCSTLDALTEHIAAPLCVTKQDPFSDVVFAALHAS